MSRTAVIWAGGGVWTWKPATHWSHLSRPSAFVPIRPRDAFFIDRCFGQWWCNFRKRRARVSYTYGWRRFNTKGNRHNNEPVVRDYWPTKEEKIKKNFFKHIKRIIDDRRRKNTHTRPPRPLIKVDNLVARTPRVV